MRRSNASTIYVARDEVGVSKHFPITHLNSPTIFETESGEVGSVLLLQGIPFDTTTNEALNYFKKIWHQALSTLSEGFSVYAHVFRKKLNLRLDGVFPDAFTKTVNEQYHAQFQHQNLYQNFLYLTILEKSADTGLLGKSVQFLDRLYAHTVKNARAIKRLEAIGNLEKVLHPLIASLQTFKPRLLGSHDAVLGYSELLTFLGSFVNGNRVITFPYPKLAMPFFPGTTFSESIGNRYPEGRIAEYLSAARLFFGDLIQMESAFFTAKSLFASRHFAAMLSLKEYGTDTSSVMLDPLLNLDSEWVSTNTFFVENKNMALSRIEKQLVRMQNANDPAISQMEELTQCRDDLSSGRLKVGYHHHTLMLMDTDREKLETNINAAIQRYNDIGFVAVSETLGLEAGFWAQIPGNRKYIVRSALTTSQNFVDFVPLHNERSGYRDRNHLGSAVTLLETASQTPLFFNFHSRGSGQKNDLTPGHTTIIGGNGSGKTVLMGFFDSQMSRYGGRSFFFDRDRGLEIYIRATGGTYLRIRPEAMISEKNEKKRAITFNPFALSDTPKNRQFLKMWMAQLVLAENEAELPAEIQKELSSAVDYVYEFLSPEYRSLRSAIQLLPIDFPRWDRLYRWVQKGDLAYLFDHAVDALDVSIAKVGFDLTELFSQPKSIFTAVCMYLMHRIQGSLDGQRVSLYFDEGWQILDHPYWKEQLKKDLPTLRKLNAHLVLATQSPESVVNSTLSAQFLDNCATNVFFCNPNADYEKHYRHFNLSVSEFAFLKETPREKRLFLYKQAEMSAIAKLNLSHMEEALAVYSANASTLKLLDSIRAVVGDDPSVWLPIFHQRRREVST